MANNETRGTPAPRLLTVITDRDDGRKLEDILREKQVHFRYMFNAMGTASSEILQAFGLSGTEKTVCVCIEQAAKAHAVMMSVVERLEFVRPGRGIAFILPLSGVCSAVSNVINNGSDSRMERWMQLMGADSETAAAPGTRGQLVVAVVNKGFSDAVMDAAKHAGARGGTIVHGRRSGADDNVKFFGISLQEEKEIVAIVVRQDKKTEMMQAINKACGMRTDAHGIVISLPIESCAGVELAAAATATASANE